MLCRRSVIDSNGLFDEVYGAGYCEENDFAARAHRHGWECAQANRAFVFHFGSRSFGDAARERRIAHNLKILRSRYPDFDYRLNSFTATLREPEVVIGSRATRLVSHGLDVLRDEGVVSLARKTTRFALERARRMFA
jgi:GT2 family glycosyltransferase